MDRIIFHIDVNSAFLSWTACDLINKGYKYDIRNSYAIICGDPEKRAGIVLAASIPAKKMGIKTAETIYNATKKCRVLKCYKSDYKLYETMSKQFIDLIKKYTPDVEQVSIDECFVDYTPVKKIYGDQFLFAKKIQKEIFDTLGFTVNIGIANNKLCAKMASDFSKPNKIHTLYKNEIENKMFDLDIGDLFGVGKKTAEKLKEKNILKVKHLATSNPYDLKSIFKNNALEMIKKANGIDDSIVDSTNHDLKGIGNEITLDHDIKEKEELNHYLLQLSELVALRLRKSNKYANVVVVTLKDNKFRRKSHQIKLKNATNQTNEIYKTTKIILNEMIIDEPIRLIGVRLDDLKENINYQISLFDEKIETKESDLDKVVDNLKDKFGNKIIKKASLSEMREKNER
ncbi:MAG: DNA polymerase IV [Mycoplasmatota bacterium]